MPTKSGVQVPASELSEPPVKLVALVAAAAKKVEHGVYNGVEHADAEAACECAEQVDDEIEGYNVIADAEYTGLGAYET